MKIKYSLLIIFTGLLAFSACKKEKYLTTETVVDNYIYGVEGEALYQSNAEKTKEKTAEQYISILYSNLFQTTVPQTTLSELAEIRQANGDKQLADELIMNSYVNTTSVIIPSDSEMRADIDVFIDATYLRFFLRMPTPYEKYELRQAIESDSEMSPELIYQGFALSNEYKYY